MTKVTVPLFVSNAHPGGVGWSSSGDAGCCGQGRQNQAAGWASEGHREDPEGAQPLTPTPPRPCAPAVRPGARSSSRAQADSLTAAQRATETRPSSFSCSPKSRASALCCCPGSSPGITHLVTEKERWEPEAKSKRSPQPGAPPTFAASFWSAGGWLPRLPRGLGFGEGSGRSVPPLSSPLPPPPPLRNALCGRFSPARGAALALIRGAAPVRARPAGLSPSAGIEEHSLNLRLS